ncbi:EamA family transporter [Isoptericola jiangsuensis]|uniref:EamA family transporter n=1 Tax=Isoptericola jiangsuensis TaxID=548579 RepID=UPI003AAB52A4
MASVEANWKWVALTAVAPIAWGSTYVVTRQLLPPDQPLWGAVLRALPAGLLLLAVARRLPRGDWWWRSLVLGTLNVGAFFVLVYVAATLLPSSVASTVMAASALVLLLLAWPLLGERPTGRGAVGAVVGMVGVVVLVADAGAGVPVAGVLASGAAMLMSSVGFVLTKRWAPAEPMVAVTAWQLTAGGLLLLPVAVMVEGGPPPVDPVAVGGFAYVAVIATALAFLAWFSGLRHLPAGTVGLVGLLNPVTGVLLGTVLADETFGVRQAVGAALVLGGVLLGRRAGARRRPAGRRRRGRAVRPDRLRRRRAAAPPRPAAARPSP